MSVKEREVKERDCIQCCIELLPHVTHVSKIVKIQDGDQLSSLTDKVAELEEDLSNGLTRVVSIISSEIMNGLKSSVIRRRSTIPISYIVVAGNDDKKPQRAEREHFLADVTK